MQEKKTVLLIDDDPEEFELFCVALEDYNSNLSCIHAKDVDDLYGALKGKQIDYIFLDFNLPQKNGFECLKLIKDVVHLNNLPIYMFSASVINKEIEVLCMETGATKWIRKPKTLKGYFEIFGEVFI